MPTYNLTKLAPTDNEYIGGAKTLKVSGSFFTLQITGGSTHQEITADLPFANGGKPFSIGFLDPSGSLKLTLDTGADIPQSFGQINLLISDLIKHVTSYNAVMITDQQPPAPPKGIPALVAKAIAGTLPPVVWAPFRYTYNSGVPGRDNQESTGLMANVSPDLAKVYADALGGTVFFGFPEQIDPTKLIDPGTAELPMISIPGGTKTPLAGEIAYYVSAADKSMLASNLAEAFGVAA